MAVSLYQEDQSVDSKQQGLCLIKFGFPPSLPWHIADVMNWTKFSKRDILYTLKPHATFPFNHFNTSL